MSKAWLIRYMTPEEIKDLDDEANKIGRSNWTWEVNVSLLEKHTKNAYKRWEQELKEKRGGV